MRTKNLLSGLVISSLLAGATQGATLRYRGSGNWADIYTGSGNGWAENGGDIGNPDSGRVPTIGDDARINFGSNTVTVTSTAGEFNKLMIGVDEPGTVVVDNGGVITTTQDVLAGNNNVNATGTLIVNNGGVVNVGRILWAANNDSTGVININAGGTVEVASHLWWGVTGAATVTIGGTLNHNGGNIGLGTSNASTASGGTAMVSILAGGVMNLDNISAVTSIQAGSLLTVNDGGLLTVKGNRTGTMNDYITAGRIAGSGTLGVSYDDVNDVTSVAVIPEPSVLGLLGVVGIGGLMRRRRF